MNPNVDPLRTMAKRNPQGICIYYGTKRKETWKELNDRSDSLASALYELGIRKGDKGIVMLHNCPEFVESVCALQKLGAVASPMNCRFYKEEIEYQTNLSEAVVFLTEDLWLENVKKAELPTVKNIIVTGESEDFLNHENLIKEYSSKEPPEVDVGTKETSDLLFTGGTTGYPKAIEYSYFSFYRMFQTLLETIIRELPSVRIPKMKLPIPFSSTIAEMIGSDFTNNLLHSSTVQKILGSQRVREGLIGTVTDRILPLIMGRLPLSIPVFAPAPVCHMTSFPEVEMMKLTGLASIVFPEKTKFDTKEFFEVIEKTRPFLVVPVPTMLKKAFDDPDIDKYDLSSIQAIVAGTAPMPPELKKRVIEKLHCMYVQVVGQSEMHPATAVKLDTEPDKIRGYSVGKATDGVQIRIADENGKDVKQGEKGEILYKGDMMMKGYYKDLEKTAEVLKEDGWLHSRDIGYFDEEGELFITGRVKYMINVGGEHVHAEEIEALLIRNPKVDEVCVMAVPDETYGQIPRAVIKLREGEKATEEEIIDWCKGKIAGIKRPKSIVFTDEIPTVVTEGKTLRKLVEERFGGK